MAVARMDHAFNKLRFLSDFKASIMQEKDQKSFFDLYSGSKEIDFLEKFGIGPVILKKVFVSLHSDHIKSYTVLSPIANLLRQSTGNCFF